MAPISGSFENTGVGFSEEVTTRAEEIERWLAEKSVAKYAVIAKRELEKFQKTIQESVNVKDYKGLDGEKMLEKFLEVATEGKVEDVLYLVGGMEMSDRPERDWARVVRSVRMGMQGKDRRGVWGTLISRDSLKLVIEGDGDGEGGGGRAQSEYLVGVIPMKKRAPHFNGLTAVRFSMVNTEKGWRVELPALLGFANEASDRLNRLVSRGSKWRDSTKVKRFGGKFDQLHQQTKAKTHDELLKSLLEDLEKGALLDFTKRFFREKKEEKKDDKKKKNRDPWDDHVDEFVKRKTERIEEAVELWGKLRSKDGKGGLVVEKVVEDKELVMAVLRSQNEVSEKMENFVFVWFLEEEGEWVVVPGGDFPGTDVVSEEQSERAAKISEEFAKGLEEARLQRVEELVSLVEADLVGGNALGEAEALKLVKDWRAALKVLKMEEVFQRSSVAMKIEDPEEFLSEMGLIAEIVAGAKVEDQELGVKSSGRFVGVSLMVDEGGDERGCPLVIVAPTKSGHRVLVDVDIQLETNKGLMLLNEEVLEGLGDQWPEADVKALAELRDWHQKVAKPAWAKWDEENSGQED